VFPVSLSWNTLVVSASQKVVKAVSMADLEN
jgi:hypothetical protein